MRRFSQRNSLVTLSDINITPLLDLAFVLLIIFVITTPLLDQSVNSKLVADGLVYVEPYDSMPISLVQHLRTSIAAARKGARRPSLRPYATR